jgi:hypothetical protein
VNAFNRDFEKYRNTHDFDYVHDDFDTSKLTWIADFTIRFDSVIPGMIGETYKMLKEKTNRFGGNSFKVTDSDIFTFGDNKYVSISTYWIRMENRKENEELFKQNTIYLFGLLGHHSEIPGYDVAVNDDEFIMLELSYRQYEFEDDTKVILKLGSNMRGHETHIHIKDGMFPKFYFFNQVKGSFKNSWISQHDKYFGQYLIHILSRQNS